MSEQIPAEAREAAARMGRVMGWQYLVRYSGQSKEWMDETLGALANAALAQPARAVPGAEEVARAIDPDAWAVVETVPRETDPRVWDSCKVRQKASRAAAKAVLALLVTQPIVAEAARLRGVAEGVEKLADEWEREVPDFERKPDQRNQGIAETLSLTADRLRALLYVDIESEA